MICAACRPVAKKKAQLAHRGLEGLHGPFSQVMAQGGQPWNVGGWGTPGLDPSTSSACPARLRTWNAWRACQGKQMESF